MRQKEKRVARVSGVRLMTGIDVNVWCFREGRRGVKEAVVGKESE